MWAAATKPFVQFQFRRHTTTSLLPILLMANQASLSFSSGSPVHAPLKRVGTHNGSFHCDEALGCFMIRLTNKFNSAEIVRSRDPQVLEDLDAVLDVGGVYDPARDRYDHHQKGFEEVFGHGFSTKLSSAGLVYKHFGKEIIAKELKVDEEHRDVHYIYLAVYKSFMEAIDAIDNGINRYDTDQPPRYVNNTHLSSRVGRLNLDWTDPDQSPEKENEAFQRAMALAGSEFLDSVRFHVNSWLPARSIVMETLEARHTVDPSGEILVLTKLCPEGENKPAKAPLRAQTNEPKAESSSTWWINLLEDAELSRGYWFIENMLSACCFPSCSTALSPFSTFLLFSFCILAPSVFVAAPLASASTLGMLSM